jgi:CspA family cold shock protein
MASGTIKKVVADRGFGFITGEDGKDYFFHRDGLTASLDFDRLAGGEKVQFDVERAPRAPARRTSRAPDPLSQEPPATIAGGFLMPATIDCGGA